MFTVIIIMCIGMFCGFLLRNNSKIIKSTDPIITYTIYLLLFLLGISVGMNKTIIKNLDNIGIKALVLTAGALLCSILVAYFVYTLFFKNNKD